MDLNEYLTTASSSTLYRPVYTETAGVLPYLYFENKYNIANSVVDQYPPNMLTLPFGAMFIFVYKPEVDGDENYLSGAVDGSTDRNPIIISHKKIGSDITLHFNPNGKEFDGATRERTLISSTDSSKYWGGDYHFLCLSLGGTKDYTGGSVNNAGWFEYFNSDYNPKLTSGQILKNNSIIGYDIYITRLELDTMDQSLGMRQFYFGRVGTASSAGGGQNSAGFRIYEMLLFIPNEKQTHNIDADTAPFQPTDIIYKKVKDYIYEKYNKLK